MYMQNLSSGLNAITKSKSQTESPNDDSVFTLTLPISTDSQLPLIDIERDTGKYIRAILMNPTESLGKEYYAAVGYYTPQQIVEDFSATFPEKGAKATFKQVTEEEYKSTMANGGLDEKAQIELLQNMLLMKPEFGYYTGKDVKVTQKVSSNILSENADAERYLMSRL